MTPPTQDQLTSATQSFPQGSAVRLSWDPLHTGRIWGKAREAYGEVMLPVKWSGEPTNLLPGLFRPSELERL